MEPILEIKDICMYFGGVHAVDSVNTYVEKGEILGVIGPNGSGKSTLINVLTGVYKPTSGSVFFQKKDITGIKTHKIAAMGIARTFQNLRLFAAMTVHENVVVGLHMKKQTSSLQAMLGTRRYRQQEAEISAIADEALTMVGLTRMRNEIATSMAYGQQKRLELARALVSRPVLCLLDEPAAGMNSAEALEMMALVKRIRKEQGISFVLIEHNMEAMMKTADRIIVMDSGRKIAEDTPEVIANDPKVIQVYLGEDADVTGDD